MHIKRNLFKDQWLIRVTIRFAAKTNRYLKKSALRKAKQNILQSSQKNENMFIWNKKLFNLLNKGSKRLSSMTENERFGLVFSRKLGL